MYRALLIEDDAFTREFFQTILAEEFSFSVSTAVDIASARHAVRSQGLPDIVIVDCELYRGDDGATALELLRKEFPEFRLIPCIGMTASLLTSPLSERMRLVAGVIYAKCELATHLQTILREVCHTVDQHRVFSRSLH